MRHDLGRSSFVLVWVEYTTLNGPCLLGASFAFGCVVCMLVPSNHTRSPSVNSFEGSFGPERFIVLAASFRAAVTSFRIQSMERRRSSTVGIVVAKFSGGINSGWYPYHTWNGEWVVALWVLALWANSMNGISSAQLST